MTATSTQLLSSWLATSRVSAKVSSGRQLSGSLASAGKRAPEASMMGTISS